MTEHKYTKYIKCEYCGRYLNIEKCHNECPHCGGIIDGNDNIKDYVQKQNRNENKRMQGIERINTASDTTEVIDNQPGQKGFIMGVFMFFIVATLMYSSVSHFSLPVTLLSVLIMSASLFVIIFIIKKRKHTQKKEPLIKNKTSISYKIPNVECTAQIKIAVKDDTKSNGDKIVTVMAMLHNDSEESLLLTPLYNIEPFVLINDSYIIKQEEPLDIYKLKFDPHTTQKIVCSFELPSDISSCEFCTQGSYICHIDITKRTGEGLLYFETP